MKNILLEEKIRDLVKWTGKDISKLTDKQIYAIHSIEKGKRIRAYNEELKKVLEQ